MYTKHNLTQQWRAGLRVTLMILMIVTLMVSFIPASAQTPVQPVEPAATAELDDPTLEVGVHWVMNYQPCFAGANLGQTRPDAEGLLQRLSVAGYATPAWTPRYNYGDGNAWEIDWKLGSLGGIEDNIVDTVDLAYFSGHGSSTGFYFGRPVWDCQLTYSDARLAWGTKDLDWVGISACLVLDDVHLKDWVWTMNRLRLLMGFKTVMSDVPFGVWFGHYIRSGYTMTQAWFAAADRTLPHGQIARVVAEEDAYFNDRPANHTSATNWDNDYYVRTHPVGSEPARYVDPNEVSQMPVYTVKAMGLAEAQNEFAHLTDVFGTTPTTPTVVYGLVEASALPVPIPIWQSSDAQLLMDPDYGLYGYTELPTLWNAEGVQAAAGKAMMSISADGAQQIATNFLVSNGMMPGDAQFYEVATDTLGVGTNARGASAAAGEFLAEETLTKLLCGDLLAHPDLCAGRRRCRCAAGASRVLRDGVGVQAQRLRRPAGGRRCGLAVGRPDLGWGGRLSRSQPALRRRCPDTGDRSDPTARADADPVQQA